MPVLRTLSSVILHHEHSITAWTSITLFFHQFGYDFLTKIINSNSSEIFGDTYDVIVHNTAEK